MSDAANNMAEDAAVDVSLLWQDYAKKRTMATRNQLIEYYLPLVNMIAGWIAISLPQHVDRDDIISSGYFGLMDAIDRYDVKLGNKFETYAGTRIRGAMLDYLRSKDWIPVSLRAKIKDYERAMARLEGKLHRTPTDAEMCEELGISLTELHNIEMQMNVSTVMPLENFVRHEEDSPLVDPTVGIEKRELKKTLAMAIDKLDDRERTVISLYYYEDLTLKEIGLILSLSEARISQIHAKAIMHIRGFLAAMKIEEL